MSELIDLLFLRCPICGQPVKEEGPCAQCRPQEQPEQMQWQNCTPAMPDCDCPIIGYTKFHLPGCKYF